MKERIILVIIKVEEYQKFYNNQNCIEEGFENVAILVQKWVDDRKIARVIEWNRMIWYEEFKEVDKCIKDPRVSRKQVRKTQMYFKVQIVLGVPKLVKNQLEYCVKNKLNITNKVTGLEYIKKLEF